jgi:hypothetical protein
MMMDEYVISLVVVILVCGSPVLSPGCKRKWWGIDKDEERCVKSEEVPVDAMILPSRTVGEV